MERMTLERALEFNLKPQPGIYPEKPQDAKSLNKWLAEYRLPVSEQAIRLYAMQSDNTKGYYYISQTDTREMTAKEREAYDTYLAAKESARAEARSKKTVKAGAVEKNTELLKKTVGLPIICFDTETTGISKTDELLQLSIYSIGSQNEPKRILNTYLRPQYLRSWEEAEKVNHISPEMVKNAPFPQDIREKVKNIFDQAKAIVGYNVSFDIRFVERTFQLDLSDKLIVDPMKIFKSEIPTSENHKLITAVKTYLPEFVKEFENGVHDSDMDTLGTIMLYQKMLDDHMHGKGMQKFTQITTDFTAKQEETQPEEDIELF